VFESIFAHPQFQALGLKFLLTSGIMITAWVVNKLAQASLDKLEKRAHIPAELLVVIRRIVKILIYTFGLIITLDHMDAKTSSILKSLGIGSLAAGFALKDALTNVISGIIIIAYKPFVIGDYIKIQPLAGQICEGRVASINLRYVSLEVDDKRTMIPNSTIVSTPVVVSKKPIDY